MQEFAKRYNLERKWDGDVLEALGREAVEGNEYIRKIVSGCLCTEEITSENCDFEGYKIHEGVGQDGKAVAELNTYNYDDRHSACYWIYSDLTEEEYKETKTDLIKKEVACRLNYLNTELGKLTGEKSELEILERMMTTEKSDLETLGRMVSGDTAETQEEVFGEAFVRDVISNYDKVDDKARHIAEILEIDRDWVEKVEFNEDTIEYTFGYTCLNETTYDYATLPLRYMWMGDEEIVRDYDETKRREEEERQKAWAEATERAQRVQEKFERAEYERLKKKYGDGDKD